MLLVSIFLGVLGIDRFMIGDTGMGILKLLTCGCCGVLTIIDWFTISKKTRELNFNKVMTLLYLTLYAACKKASPQHHRSSGHMDGLLLSGHPLPHSIADRARLPRVRHDPRHARPAAIGSQNVPVLSTNGRSIDNCRCLVHSPASFKKAFQGNCRSACRRYAFGEHCGVFCKSVNRPHAASFLQEPLSLHAPPLPPLCCT